MMTKEQRIEARSRVRELTSDRLFAPDTTLGAAFIRRCFPFGVPPALRGLDNVTVARLRRFVGLTGGQL